MLEEIRIFYLLELKKNRSPIYCFDACGFYLCFWFLSAFLIANAYVTVCKAAPSATLHTGYISPYSVKRPKALSQFLTFDCSYPERSV